MDGCDGLMDGWLGQMDGCDGWMNGGGVRDVGDGEGYDDYGDYEDDCCENNISILCKSKQLLLFCCL